LASASLNPKRAAVNKQRTKKTDREGRSVGETGGPAVKRTVGGGGAGAGAGKGKFDDDVQMMEDDSDDEDARDDDE
jgi:hypothetical protein